MRAHFVLIILAAVCIACNSAVLATDRLVPSQYPTIQAAIDDCNNGDIVILAPNTYTGPGNRDIDFKGLEITVRSTKPNDPDVVAATVINCQGSYSDPHRGFYFHSGEDFISVLDGLTITNGYGNSDGGGIYCIDSSPIISRCVIKGNKGKDGIYEADEKGGSGGGIYCSGSSATLKECTITNNITGQGSPDVEPTGDSGDGGGIYCISSSLTIRDCIISNNRTNQGVNGYFITESKSGSGAGVYCESSTIEIYNSAVTGNAVLRGGLAEFDQAKTGNGGGICCISCPSVSISSCEISGNATGNGTESRGGCEPGGFGGGIYCVSSMITLTDSIINGNITGLGGMEYFGGLGCDGGHGGGIYCTSSTAIANNCIISNNITGAGASIMEFKGGNGGDGAGIYYEAACSVTLKNCCITGNTTGPGGNVTSFFGDGGNGGDGGGIYMALYNVVAEIRNCTISGNQTGAGGTGGPEGGVDGSYGVGAGSYVRTSTSITNTIIWGNSPDELVGHSCSNVRHCDVGGYICSGLRGNISANPLFVTGPLGDYYLSQIAAGQASNSQCVDAGSDTAVNLGMDILTTRTDELWDKDTVDMGYHYSISPGSPDIYENWHIDLFDYVVLAGEWLNCNEESVLPGDITRDTCVNGKDLKVLVECWLDCYVTKATNPGPANHAHLMDTNVTLIWVPGEGAIYHDVYLGTDNSAVANAGHLSPEFMGTVSEAVFDPCVLELETIYYWRIDEVGPACITQGDIWGFTIYGDPNFHLVGYWKFDEDEGSIAYDSAGTNDGTIYGAGWTTGIINGALSFDGDNDYVDFGNNGSLNLSEVTVSVWIKTGSTDTGFSAIVVKGIAYNENLGMYIRETTGLIRLQFSSGGTYTQDETFIYGSTNILDQSWHNAVGSFDGSVLKIYIDGSLQTTGLMTTKKPDANISQILTVGVRNDAVPVLYFNGTIDDVRIYDRALSAEEIHQLYQDGLN